MKLREKKTMAMKVRRFGEREREREKER